ncbi:MAG TPA: HAMP domain-containing sensor histidine kinase [Thermoanaerobaculia bacterium]|nr:HAMP domain-containing sensor histidine kinase [Thermoanaerobaculia bacterium]
MTSRAVTAVLLVLTLASLLTFAYVLRQLSTVTTGLAAHAEIERQLRQSLEDQKKLTRLDPASANDYRRRFDDSAALLGHLRGVQLNRGAVARQVEQVLIGLVALILASGIALYLIERRSREGRLVRLEAALTSLSRGEQEIVLDDRRQDVIGRIAAAIERTSRAAAQDRRQLRYLEHLSAWQEASRRHAHEIRTPLAAARMEVERFASAMTRRTPDAAPEIEAARGSILEEIDHLGEFTRNFTSFATIPKPRLRTLDLQQLVQDFCARFATAWPGVRLVCTDGHAALVNADGEMLRQVLVNLANNSALALGAAGGTISFALRSVGSTLQLDVADDGPGVAPEIKGRLFEPYTTTRGIGEGMGLGLAIAKKIMLDHGGDLDLVDDAHARGATFRLTLPGATP